MAARDPLSVFPLDDQTQYRTFKPIIYSFSTQDTTVHDENIHVYFKQYILQPPSK